MIKHTRRNRRSAFAGFFSSNTMVGVQSSVLANVSAGNRSAHVLRMQPETLLLEDRVMPVVNLSVSDLTIVEGDAGTKDALFSVTRSGDSNAAFTVDYQTEDGTAKAGQDYLGNSGTLTFLAGENLKQVSVAVIGNNVLQVDRAFSLKILNPKQLQSPDIQFGTADFTQRFNVNVGIVRAADLNGDNNTDIFYQLYNYTNAGDSIGYKTDGFGPTFGQFVLPLASLEGDDGNPIVDADITSLQTTDFDKNNANDIVVGTNHGVLIFRNNPQDDIPYGTDKDKGDYHYYIMGKVNNVIPVTTSNGQVDLIGCTDNSIFVMQNKNDGTGYLPQKSINEGTVTENIVSGDFNGDGINDFIAIQGDKILEFIGNTDGSYTPISTVRTETSCKSMAVGDFNRDGKSDLAIQSEDSMTIYVYSGTNVGIELVSTIDSFYLSEQIYNNAPGNINDKYYNGLVGSLENSEIAVADFNMDGNFDIAVSGPSGVMLGDGSFRFTDHGQSQQSKNHLQKAYQRNSWPVPSNDNFRSIGVGDINNDGTPDLLTNINTQVMVDYSSPNFVISSPQFIGNTETNGIRCFLSTGDFNNDGKLDFLTTGGIEYTDSVETPISSSGSKDLAFVQLGDSTSSTVSYPLFSNNLNNPKTFDQSLADNEFTLSEGIIVDLNNKEEVSNFIAIVKFKNINFNQIRIYTYNNDAINLEETTYEATHLTAGDYDFDGNNDFAYSNSINEIGIVYGSGKGRMAFDSGLIATNVGTVQQLFTKDIDSNGYNDIIVVGQTGFQVIFCQNNRTTAPPITTPSLFSYKSGLNLTNIIGAGTCLTGIDTSGSIAFTQILNSGSGGVTVKVAQADASATAADTADFNKDGFTDFVQFGPLKFFQMDLNGVVKIVPAPIGVNGPLGISDHAFVDLNNNSYLDVLYTTSSGTATWLTNTTQPVTFKFITDTASGKINDDDIPATISIVSGDGQSTGINQPYIDPLSVIVKNANGTPVSGAAVVFTANIGQNGSTGSFDTIPQITTNSSGIAVSPTLKANSKAGQFTVNATATDGTINPMIAFNLFSKMSMGFQTADVSVQEGDYGLSYLVLQVVRTGQTEYPGSVTYSTIDGSAKSGVDYQYVSTRLNFASSETSKKISIPIIGNTKLQLDRAFSIDFSDPYADPSIPWLFQIPKTPATVAIKDDDAPTKVVAQDGDNQKMGIGEAFLKPLTVIVQNINGNPVSGVSVSFQVSVGSNLATAKFANSNSLISDANGRAVSSQLTAGQIPGTFQVIATATGNGQTAIGKFNETVIPLIQYTVADSSIIEGDTGTKQMVFTIRRGGSTSLVTTVDYSTVDGSAIAGTDYASTFGKLTFAANEIAKKVTVPIFTNTIFQSDRAFQFALSNPVWIPGQDIVFQTPVASALGKITDDDNPQYISIVTGDQQSNLLGTDFATPLSVRVQNLNGSAVSGVPISFVIRPGIGDVNATFESSDILISDSTGTAVAPRLTAGLTPGSFSVYATASGYLSSKSAIFQLTQRGKITYSIADSSVKEGDSGKTPMVFNITRSGSTWLDSSIDYKTVDGTAFAGTDYESASGRIYFAPNELTKTIRVNVIGNSTSQVDRSFGVALNLPAGINPQPNDFVLPPSPAQGTIMDDDSVIAAARFIKQSAPTPAPAPQPVLQSYSVQKGASSRSFVRYVDLVLNNVNAATNLISSIASSAPRIRLTNKGLSGTSNSPVSLQGFAKSNGTSVNIDFGTKGLGGSPTTSTADGSYLLEMDLDANGSYETSMRFHRLLGDVNGDKVVNSKDTSLANSSLNKSGFNLHADTNGDGKVNATDVAYIKKAQKRKILV